MSRWVVRSFLLIACGCSGSGATIGDSSASDISEGKASAVEAPKPVEPVDPTTTIECKTSKPLSDGSIHTIRFTLRGGALDSEITIEPPLSTLSSLVKPSLERKEGKLVLSGEARTEVTLFENSDLTRGYVKASGEYSDLYCTTR